MEFGQKLKESRIRAGMTQEDVARQVGVSRQTMSSWENDRSYPDLASVLKLSDLYELSLDALLREDGGLKQKLEQRKNKIKLLASLMHDFALLLIASTIVLHWLDKTTLGIALGVLGIVLICGAHLLFVLRLGSDWKLTGLRCAAVVMWFTGFMIRILSSHLNVIGNILWYSSLALYWYGGVHWKWDTQYPKHMTVFTGFVIAMVLVFGTVPFLGDSVKLGGFNESNPFDSQDYRVAEVLCGDEEELPMVYLDGTNRVYLDYPGQPQEDLGGQFTYITQPEGAPQQGIWELIPETDPETRCRVTVEADDSVVLSCLRQETLLWAYRLEHAPLMGVQIKDVLGLTTMSVPWTYSGAFDQPETVSGPALRGKGTLSLSIPGSPESITLCEEYHGKDGVTLRTLTLERNGKNRYTLELEADSDDRGAFAIYHVPYEDGEFVLAFRFIA